LEEPRYSIEQIAAKTGKSPVYCVGRLKLTELSPAVVEAFSKEEIGVGHALLLARLQTAQQEEALNACFREEWMGADQKPKRILLPVRQLQVWIERNVLLILKDAPFDRENPQLVSAAGSCLDCPKRTGHNKFLFAGISENSDACSDPDCYSAKLDAHVQTTIAAKPKLIHITLTANLPKAVQFFNAISTSKSARTNRSRSAIGRSTGLALRPRRTPTQNRKER
jgi:ParB family transcriptional regulator, chromosome partitioning protein